MIRHLMPLALAAGLAGCATTAEPPPADVGRILHYVRSNQDGTEVERISTFRASATELQVYKMRERCTNAALVTAHLDPDGREALSLVGGRLTRDGTQEAFAWLSHDAAADTLTVSVEGPSGAPLETLRLPGGAPWRLYDFDFADWNAFATAPVRGRDLVFDMALIWPEPEDGEGMMRPIGTVTAHFVGEALHLDVPTFEYALTGGGFSGGSGARLWLDRRDGTIVEAALNLPNHPGYRDYRLVKVGEDDGELGWRSLLADHWTGCPVD